MQKRKKENNKYRMLRVSRQLSPEYQVELLELVRQEYTTEKSLGHLTANGGVSAFNQQEYSCENM